MNTVQTNKNKGRSAKHAVLAILIMAVLVLTPLILNGVDSATDLVFKNSGGEEVEDPILDGPAIYFESVNDGTGITFKSLSDNVRIDVSDMSLCLKSDVDVGAYYIDATAKDVNGYLVDTGIRFVLVNGDSSAVADLTAPDYNSPFNIMTEDTVSEPQPFAFSSNTDYGIQIYTYQMYEATTPPEGFEGMSFEFTFRPTTEWREITFINEGETLKTILKNIEDTIGDEFPEVEKPGYKLDGWYCNDALVTEDTNVGTLDVDEEGVSVIEAKWILVPSGDWPKITDRLIEEQTYEDKKYQKWETTYLWQDGSKYIIESDIYVDLQDKYLDGVANATFKVKGQEECTLWISDDGERVLVAVPQINNLFLQ